MTARENVKSALIEARKLLDAQIAVLDSDRRNQTGEEIADLDRIKVFVGKAAKYWHYQNLSDAFAGNRR